MLLSDMIALRDARNLPPGLIRIVPTGQLPLGFAWMTGLELDRAVYSKAFAYFGTTWGAGNLTTTFNLPDVRSRLIGYAASMGGSQPANWISPGGIGGANVAPVLGATGGSDRYGALNLSQVPTHLHSFVKSLLSADAAAGPVLSGGALQSDGDVPVYQLGGTQNTGSGGPISVVPPIGIFNICVSLGREYAAVTPVPPPGFAATTEEFNGPYQNWTNVVTKYGADPTGVLDSTAAFQALANAMNVSHEGEILTVPDSGFVGFNDMYSLVGYIPPGRYKITQTIQWGVDADGNPNTSGGSSSLIGDHPDTVELIWEGAPGGDIIWISANHSPTFSRITFNGNNKSARSGIRYERAPGGVSMTGGAVQDCIFKDCQNGFYNTAETGISGTDSEMSIYRNQFYRCGTGVFITQSQAFDYWCFCNYFESCGVGISNNVNGQFNAYYNFFNGSLNYDLYVTGGGSVVGAAMLGEIRWNYSENSSRFIHVDSCNQTIVANRVINPQQVDCFEFTTRVVNGAGRNKVSFLANEIYLPAGATEGAVLHEIWLNPDPAFPIPASALAAQAQPTCFLYKNIINLNWDINNVISLDPRFTNVMLLDNATGQTIDPTAPLIPAVPETITRTVFQLRQGNLAQGVVDSAAAFALANPGSRPVIYAPTYASGSPSLNSYQNTIIFPANIEMSLQGDFQLNARGNIQEDRNNWLGGAHDPMVLFQGPSLMTILNMRIGVSQQESGESNQRIYGDVIVDVADQVGAYAYLNNCRQGFHYDTCSNLVLDMTAKDTESFTDYFLPNYVKADVTNPTGLGRVLLESGTGTGQDDPSQYQYQVQPGGKFFCRGYWGENNNTISGPSDVYKWFSADGTGSSVASHLSIEASRLVMGEPVGGFQIYWDTISQFVMNNYTGSIVLLDDFYLGIGTFTGTNSGAKWLSLSGDLALIDLPSSHNSRPPIVNMLNWSFQGFTNPLVIDLSEHYGNYVPKAGDLAVIVNTAVSVGTGGISDVTPAGFTLVGSFQSATDAGINRSVNTGVFFRILDGSETVLTMMAGDTTNDATLQVFRSYGGGTWGAATDVVQEVDLTFATTSINYVAPSGVGLQHTFLAGMNSHATPTMAPTPADAGVDGTGTLGASYIGYGIGNTPTAGTASTTISQPFSLGNFFIPLTGSALPSYPVPVHYQQEGLSELMMPFNIEVVDDIPDGGSSAGFWGPRGAIGSVPADLAAQLDALIAVKAPTVVTTGQTPGVTSVYCRRSQFDIQFMKAVYTPTIG